MITAQMKADLKAVGRSINSPITTRLSEDQENFKHKVRRNFNGRCAVTGYALLECVADVTQIEPGNVAANMNTSNGLYLEASLHRMYNEGLMGIHPDKLTVHFAMACLHKDNYEGCTLQPHVIALDTAKLRARWEIYLSK